MNPGGGAVPTMRGGFGQQGRQQTNDCTFDAGKINGTPIKVSYFLVIMFAYQVFQAYEQTSGTHWFLPIGYAVGTQLLLLATILCHEFGHGLMATYLGGSIAQILLWPFGGICFSTRPTHYLDARTKIKNELKIVSAGPATHFLQTPFWLCMLYILQNVYQHIYEIDTWTRNHESLLWLCVPLTRPPRNPFSFEDFPFAFFLWMLMSWAVTTNVYLFLFNVFFPMYPMDSAKIVVCTLQLCGTTAHTAARTLIYTSVPMSLLLAVYAYSNRAGGMMPAITGYMAIMCLIEAYNIYQLMKQRKLHTHHLFELARSDTTYDRNFGAQRINMSVLDDDVEEGRNRGTTTRGTIPSSNYILFEGQGVRLDGGNTGGPGNAGGPSIGGAAAPNTNAGTDARGRSQNSVTTGVSTIGERSTGRSPAREVMRTGASNPTHGNDLENNTPPKNEDKNPLIKTREDGRTSFLDRIEQQGKDKKKTVRDLANARM